MGEVHGCREMECDADERTEQSAKCHSDCTKSAGQINTAAQIHYGFGDSSCGGCALSAGRANHRGIRRAQIANNIRENQNAEVLERMESVYRTDPKAQNWETANHQRQSG